MKTLQWQMVTTNLINCSQSIMAQLCCSCFKIIIYLETEIVLVLLKNYRLWFNWSKIFSKYSNYYLSTWNVHGKVTWYHYKTKEYWFCNTIGKSALDKCPIILVKTPNGFTQNYYLCISIDLIKLRCSIF